MQGNLNIFKTNTHFPGISLEVDVSTVSEKIALLALTFALYIVCKGSRVALQDSHHTP